MTYSNTVYDIRSCKTDAYIRHNLYNAARDLFRLLAANVLRENTVHKYCQ